MTKYKLPDIELKDDRYCDGCPFLMLHPITQYLLCVYLDDDKVIPIRHKDCPLIEVKEKIETEECEACKDNPYGCQCYTR